MHMLHNCPIRCPQDLAALELMGCDFATGVPCALAAQLPPNLQRLRLQYDMIHSGHYPGFPEVCCLQLHRELAITAADPFVECTIFFAQLAV